MYTLVSNYDSRTSKFGQHEFIQKLWPNNNVGAQNFTFTDALLGPGVNPLEGSPNVKLRKLGPKGTLLASNSRKG
jgi:hypothetical protein